MADDSGAKTRTRPTPPLSSLTHLSFSQDGSCVVAADSTGVVHWLCCKSFKLRGLYQERDATRTIVAACGDMLDEMASTCAVVTCSKTGGCAAVVRRWKPGYMNHHWRYDDWAAEIEGDAAEVRAVHVHGDKTLLVHDGRVDVYGYGPDKDDGGVLHRVDTRGGGEPICAVSSLRAPLAFACAGTVVGEARVERWAGEEFAPPLYFPAHSSRLECMAMSWDGRLVATASFKGTIVRVFIAADGTLLRELRRGADRADIYSMSFSPDSKWLAVSSDKGTVHVFSINVDLSSSDLKDSHEPNNLHEGPAAKANAKEQDVNRGSYGSFLSGFVPKYFKQDGSLAKFRLREGEKYLVAFSHEPNTILIIGMDGSFYRCKFDPVNAGEMKRVEYMNFMKTKRGC